MWGRSFVLLSVFLAACSSEPEPPIKKLEGLAQGTTYHISYWTDVAVDEQAVEAAVLQDLADIDKTMSNYRPDSTIEQFNARQSLESQEVGAEIVALFKVAYGVYQLSQGCFDLTIKPLFDLWGFQGDTLTIPDQASIDQGLNQVGMSKVEVVDETHLRKAQANVRIDVSAVAQGYSVGRVSRALEKQGIQNYLVEIGGELETHGVKPNGQAWRIAVEKPLPGERSLQKIITMPKDAPMTVMTSGTYRHYFDANGQRYSHILDARTGKPVSHDLVAVTVLHEDPTVADAWSTALLCLGQQDGMQLANDQKINALFIRQRGTELSETRSDALRTSGRVAIQ